MLRFVFVNEELVSKSIEIPKIGGKLNLQNMYILHIEKNSISCIQ